MKIDIKETIYKGANWIYLTRDSAKRRTVLNTVMKLSIQRITENFLNGGATGSSEEGPCFVDLVNI
jgi:hypothetical protein